MPTRDFDTWGWVVDVDNNSGDDLNFIPAGTTYTVGDSAIYRDDLVWRDEYSTVTDSTAIGDSDLGDGTNSWGTENGILVNGEFSHVNEVVQYTVDVTLKKPGQAEEVVRYSFRAFQLDRRDPDDPIGNTDSPNAGLTFIRPADSDTQDMINRGYHHTHVQSIEIVSIDGGERNLFFADSHNLAFFSHREQ